MEEIISMFKRWITNKINVHLSEKIVYFKERQIWWVALGQNVGSEQNGKREHFERPVLLLKKFGYKTFLAVPSSSKVRNDLYHFVYIYKKGTFYFNLSQVRVLSYKRLIRLSGQMEEVEFNKVREALKKIL